MEAENRTLRDWSTDRFMSMNESMQAHDNNIVQALQNIHALQLEDSVCQRRIEEASKSLEVLLRMAPSTSMSLPRFTTTPAPAPSIPSPAPAPVPTPNIATTVPPPVPIVVEDVASEGEDSEEMEIDGPKKRGRSIESQASSSKRRKR